MARLVTLRSVRPDPGEVHLIHEDRHGWTGACHPVAWPRRPERGSARDAPHLRRTRRGSATPRRGATGGPDGRTPPVDGYPTIPRVGSVGQAVGARPVERRRASPARVGARYGDGVAELPGVLGEPIRFILNWGRKYSLWVFNFGLACCAIEFIATSMGRHDFMRLGVIPFAHGPRQADLMVVSGTVTDKMAPAIKRLYDQMPEPKYVISFGACANCGGPYWDSYSVTKGVDQIIPVDVYIPGCPPRPEALLHGILRLQEKIAAEQSGFGGVTRVDPLGPAGAAALTAPPVPAPSGSTPAPGTAATPE
jgi:NADH-quinone oxidoreductase subunit B